MNMMILPFKNIKPKIDSTVWLAPTSVVIGDVEIGENSSVWFQTVVRGDVNSIRIGKNTNIQDLSMLHVTNKSSPRPASLIIGDNVTVGHRAILHGCTIADGCLIGMGSVVMDRVVVGEGAMVAAGSLVPEGLVIPPGYLAIGSPAKVLRPLKDDEKKMLKFLPDHYRLLAKEYS